MTVLLVERRQRRHVRILVFFYLDGLRALLVRRRTVYVESLVLYFFNADLRLLLIINSIF